MSNTTVVNSGGVTFKNSGTTYGSLAFTAANALQLKDSDGGTSAKVKLANSSLTAPLITDENNNEQLEFGTTASAVNHLKMTNAAAGASPTLSAVGSDTNVSLKLLPKGDSGTVTVGHGGVGVGYCIIDSVHPNTLVLRGGSEASGSTAIYLGNSTVNGLSPNVVIQPGSASGAVVIGTGSAKASLQSNGAQNLELKANGGTGGVITIPTASNGDITLAPNGSGAVTVGSGSAAGILESNGNQDLVLRTGNTDTGTITITDGAHQNITLAPNGTGVIAASSDLVMASGKDVQLVAGRYIKTSGKTTLLQCNADGLVVNGTMTWSSDARLKKNLSRCGGVDVVSRLTGWQWDWRSNGLPSAGVLAQEVRDVLPYAVQENENGLSVNYNALHGVLIEAVKDLAAEVAELRSLCRQNAGDGKHNGQRRYNLRQR